MSWQIYDANGALKTSVPVIAAASISGTIASSQGGTGQNFGASSGVLKFATGTASLVSSIGISEGGTGQTTQTAAMDALSPTTTKGDLLLDDGTNVIRLPVGANYSHLSANSGASAGAKWVPSSHALLEWQETSGTNTGTSVATTWTTLTLNTEVEDADNIVTISSNKFTPIAGKYRINVLKTFRDFTAANMSVRLRLRNVTSSSVLVTTPNFTVGNATVANVIIGATAALYYVFTAKGTDEYDLQYYSTQASAYGLGQAISEAGAVERYMQVFLETIG